ncbi:MAG TPA: hypothetical protein DDY13_01460 [Cytophagales bacterium]|jgi:hypothetical protein|nr:hypothetical protein [Cytophagales bacterium]
MDRSENNNRIERKEKKGDLKHYFGFREVFGYFFRKKDPNKKSNFNLRMMHGINKISIIMFLVALIVIIVRRIM